MIHPLVLLSFLGTGNYESTTYTWQDKTCRTQFIQVAVNQFFEPSQHFVARTKKAHEKNGGALDKMISYGGIEIPEGNNESDLWETFKVISESIPDESRLILDVTHGLRHQPMMALAIAVFLRTVKSVEIERIVYGAYEARTETNESPVFDLTPFLDIIDWASATSQFLKYGNANNLGNIFRKIQKETRTGTKKSIQAKELQTLGGSLAFFGSGLSLVRPIETVGTAKRLRKNLEKATLEISEIPQTYPFAHLLQKTNDRIDIFTLKESDSLFSKEGLNFQASLIQYYLDTNQLVQACTMAREAMVNKLLFVEKVEPWLLYEGGRKGAEVKLNLWAKPEEKAKDKKAIGGLWANIRKVRNDINHAGMREDHLLTKTLQKKICNYCKEVIDWLKENQ